MAKGAYIAGKWAAGDGDWFEKTCPATGDTSWEGQAASAAQVNQAVENAREAGKSWRHMPQHDRTRILEAYAEEIGVRATFPMGTSSRRSWRAIPAYSNPLSWRRPLPRSWSNVSRLLVCRPAS